MNKVILSNIGFLAFFSLLLFNSSLEFAEAKVFTSNKVDLTTKSSIEGTYITVYNQNKALIKEKRVFDLSKGINCIDWDNLPATIDLRSVNLNDVKVPANGTATVDYALASKL